MYGGSGTSPWRSSTSSTSAPSASASSTTRRPSPRSSPTTHDARRRRARTPMPGGTLRLGRTSASHARARRRPAARAAAPPPRRPSASSSREPGRQHPRGVDHHDVAGPDERRQVADVPVLGRRARPAVDEQPGRVPRLDRRLGDGARAAGRSRARPCPWRRQCARAAGERLSRAGRAGGSSPGARRGAASPRWAKAAAVATRPRGVRMSRPPWMRNGS